jgi:hypothetical protein
MLRETTSRCLCPPTAREWLTGGGGNRQAAGERKQAKDEDLPVFFDVRSDPPVFFDVRSHLSVFFDDRTAA